MPGTYTISELAREAEVPASTVRYYERSGLLPPDGRTESNYRVYSSRSLERLRFIRAAQASGFTLRDVASLLDVMDGAPEQCGEVQDLIETRLDRLDGKITELRQARATLAEALDVCRHAERSDACDVVEDLRKGCGPDGCD
jgi:DNA-binding transcriptional MerR regulator